MQCFYNVITALKHIFFRSVLMICVICYFIMSGILTWHTSSVEKGTFATVLQVDPSGLDPNDSWSASSNLKR